MRRFKAQLLVAATIGLFAGQAALAAVPAEKMLQNHEFVPGEVVLRLNDAESLAAAQVGLLQSLQSELGAGAVLSIRQFRTDASLQKLKLADASRLAETLDLLNRNPQVKYAEPNYILRVQGQANAGIPNDAEFGQLWGMQNTGQTIGGKAGKAGVDVNVVPLWAQGHTGSRSVVVAVIDTGVDWDHPDLRNNIYTNGGEISGNGVDDDGNGFIDDVHGWNFAGKNNNSRDDHDHGTHCAGTIGGEGNNDAGVAGVVWQASILPIKFLTASGSGSLEDAVESIKYATQMRVRIMSNSWGGGGFTQTMKDAIIEAKNAGILFVAAAGNASNDNDASPAYPAGYDVDNVLSVAAIHNQEGLASFSSYGARTVHVSAPGVAVYSTTKGGNYASFSGTSMATPHTAGIAALMMSINSQWDYAEIKRRLIKTSTPVGAFRRKVASRGRVNAYNAVNGIEAPSTEPDEALWQDYSFTAESDHPYKNNDSKEFDISVPGAKFIRVHFEKVDTEAGYDKITLLGSTTTRDVVETVSGAKTDYMTDYVEGSEAVLKFETDRSVNGWGFKVDKIQVIFQTAAGKWQGLAQK